MTALEDLSAIGGVLAPGTPAPGQPFFEFSAVVLRPSVGAFCRVTVIGAGGVPVEGAKVVNLFPDGNGEVLLSDGSGSVQANFGASSAFSIPGRGPFTFFIADQAVKDFDSKQVRWGRILSDQVRSLGDWQGEHSEIYLQFVQRAAVRPPAAVAVVADLGEPALRAMAWNQRGIDFNPDAALFKRAQILKLGYPLSGEFPFRDVVGRQYVGQLFAGGLVWCPLLNAGDVHVVSWLG